jgi:hypothetical protein
MTKNISRWARSSACWAGLTLAVVAPSAFAQEPAADPAAPSAAPADPMGHDHHAHAHAVPAEQKANPRAPVIELAGCPIGFRGLHVRMPASDGLYDFPLKAPREMPADHFCHPVSQNVVQCVLYLPEMVEGEMTRRLIGTEHLVTPEYYEKYIKGTPQEAFWHDHKYEVDACLLLPLSDEAAKIVPNVRELYGMAVHVWDPYSAVPYPPVVFGSFTGEAPRDLPPAVNPDWPADVRAAAQAAINKEAQETAEQGDSAASAIRDNPPASDSAE